MIAGININAVCPGVVRTAQAGTNLRDPAIIAEMRKETPWPRLGEPIDLANMVVFLCTNKRRGSEAKILRLMEGSPWG